MRIKVYRNLNKKCLSVVALQGPDKGRVIDRVQTITLTNCLFRVSEAGRQRVLREKRKNVHAFVYGDRTSNEISPEAIRIAYNPYRFSTFVKAESQEPIFEAKRVQILADGMIRAEK